MYFEIHIITKDIDDLHERAGSTKVMHWHGEIFKMRSEFNVTEGMRDLVEILESHL